MCLCVVVGPPGASGPSGNPGQDCNCPVVGPPGYPGCRGPDGDPGQTLMFRFNKLTEFKLEDF